MKSTLVVYKAIKIPKAYKLDVDCMKKWEEHPIYEAIESLEVYELGAKCMKQWEEHANEA